MMSPRIFKFLLALISLYITVSANDCARDAGDHLAGTCNNQFGDRRPSASELYYNLPDFNENLDPYKPTDKYQIPAERHHVIPFNTLRDFFNKLVERIGVKPPANQQSDAKKLEVFFDAIYQSSKDFYMKYCPKWENVPQDQKIAKTQILQKFIKGLKMETLLNNKNINSRPGGYEDFIPYFTWLPGNLFIGPDHEHRTDDPGENFEKNAGTIVPKSDFTALKNAYEQMQKYIKNPEDKSINFSLLSSSLKQVLSKTQIYPFKKSNWKIDPKKQKYSIA